MSTNTPGWSKYQMRAMAGHCKSCGRKRAVRGYCRSCRESRKESQRRIYHDRREEGLCVTCAGRLVPNWTYVRCLTCKERYG